MLSKGISFCFRFWLRRNNIFSLLIFFVLSLWNLSFSLLFISSFCFPTFDSVSLALSLLSFSPTNSPAFNLLSLSLSLSRSIYSPRQSPHHDFRSPLPRVPYHHPHSLYNEPFTFQIQTHFQFVSPSFPSVTTFPQPPPPLYSSTQPKETFPYSHSLPQ